MKNALMVFIKNAEHGKVKTRLASSIGNEQALEVYKELLTHTLQVTKPVAANKYVFYSERIEDDDNWQRNNFVQQLQSGERLGERMSNAFQKVFELGNAKAVIVGSDCFDLTTNIIANSFDALDDNDVVIGPALDGGYYLLGMKQHQKLLFENIEWSTPTVLADTLELCKQHGLSYTLLPALSDIDTISDLKDYNRKKVL